MCRWAAAASRRVSGKRPVTKRQHSRHRQVRLCLRSTCIRGDLPTMRGSSRRVQHHHCRTTDPHAVSRAGLMTEPFRTAAQSDPLKKRCSRSRRLRHRRVLPRLLVAKLLRITSRCTDLPCLQILPVPHAQQETMSTSKFRTILPANVQRAAS